MMKKSKTKKNTFKLGYYNFILFWICTWILCGVSVLPVKADVTKDGYVFQIEQPDKAGIVCARVWNYDEATGKLMFITTDEKNNIVPCARSLDDEVFSAPSVCLMWYDPAAKEPLTYITKEQAQTFVIKNQAGKVLGEDVVSIGGGTTSGINYSFCFQCVGKMTFEYKPAGFVGEILPFYWNSIPGNYGFYEKLPTDSTMTEGWISGNAEAPFYYSMENRSVYFLCKEDKGETQRVVFKTEEEQKNQRPDIYVQYWKNRELVLEKADDNLVKVERQQDLNGYHVYKLSIGSNFDSDRLIIHMMYENKNDKGDWEFAFDYDCTLLCFKRLQGLYMADGTVLSAISEFGENAVGVKSSFYGYRRLIENDVISLVFGYFDNNENLRKTFCDPKKLHISPTEGLEIRVTEDCNPGTCEIEGMKPGIYTITSDGIPGEVTIEVVQNPSGIFRDKKLTQKISEKELQRLEVETGDTIYVRIALQEDEWFDEANINKMKPAVNTYQKGISEEGLETMMLKPVKKNPPLDVEVLTFTDRLLVIELTANKNLEDYCEIAEMASISFRGGAYGAWYIVPLYKKGTVFGKEIAKKDGEYSFESKMADGSYKVSYTPVGKIKKKKIVSIAENVTIDGKKYAVNSIGRGAFQNNKKLRKVVFPKTICEIGYNAFGGCKNLTTADLSKTKVEVIEEEAFRGTKIKSVTLPEQTKILKTGAFKNCKNLKSVVFGKEIKQVDKDVFKGAKNIQTVTFKGTAKLNPKKMKGLKDLGKNVVIKVPGEKMAYYKKLLKAVGFKGTVKEM